MNSEPAMVATDGATFEVGYRGLRVVRATLDGSARVEAVAQQWRNTSPERLAGRLAEELHVTTFNADAAAKGFQRLRAVTGASRGAPTAAADLSILQGGRVVDAAQVKYHGSPAGTAFHVANVKYDGMQRIVPADQAPRVRDLARARGVDGLGQRNYPATAADASDRIRFQGVESTPVSRTQALEAARNPHRIANELVTTRVVNAVASGALAGAAIGGGVSAVSNVLAYANNTRSGERAFANVAIDTVTCAASGAAVSGTAVMAEAVLLRAGARALARGAAPVAIGLTLVAVAKDVGRYATGEITGASLAVNAGRHVVTGGTTWGGMEAGAAIGTWILPGFGTILGGILGGIGGALFGGWVTR